MILHGIGKRRTSRVRFGKSKPATVDMNLIRLRKGNNARRFRGRANHNNRNLALTNHHGDCLASGNHIWPIWFPLTRPFTVVVGKCQVTVIVACPSQKTPYVVSFSEPDKVPEFRCRISFPKSHPGCSPLTDSLQNQVYSFEPVFTRCRAREPILWPPQADSQFRHPERFWFVPLNQSINVLANADFLNHLISRQVYICRTT
jgi:hypothetical protein